ncbi:MAG: ImmA/IrrE family metallo-endopeptidase [Flavipsychrobacter sp.]|nr:ImmA/IrrE family metallo-endopeptidase [Flavipsychrobacter sp.]
MNQLFREALLKADDVRSELGLNIYEPINVFDACSKLGVTVRFVEINMEGLYIKHDGGNSPTILLSNQRPLPRRCFTCAHELGHHVFNHGFKIDGLSDSNVEGSNDSDELLVDSFAGALLMPVAGIQAELAKRRWKLNEISPLNFYTICSVFGVGYRTLLTHCKVNKLISEIGAGNLLKASPKSIFSQTFGDSIQTSYFKIVDGQSKINLVDLEVSNHIVLPVNTVVEGNHIEFIANTSIGAGFRAVRPGIARAVMPSGKATFIRVQSLAYSGLAENRHLEII